MEGVDPGEAPPRTVQRGTTLAAKASHGEYQRAAGRKAQMGFLLILLLLVLLFGGGVFALTSNLLLVIVIVLVVLAVGGYGGRSRWRS